MELEPVSSGQVLDRIFTKSAIFTTKFRLKGTILECLTPFFSSVLLWERLWLLLDCLCFQHKYTFPLFQVWPFWPFFTELSSSKTSKFQLKRMIKMSPKINFVFWQKGQQFRQLNFTQLWNTLYLWFYSMVLI